MVVNTNLQSAFREATKKGLQFLNDLNKKDKSLKQSESFLNNIDHLYELDTVNKLIQSLEQISQLTDRITKLVSPKTHDAIHTTIKQEFIEKVFLHYTKNGQTDYDENRFQCIYSDLEDYIYGKADFHYLAPLYQFTLSQDFVVVDDITIRKIDPKEFKELFGLPHQFFYYNPLVFGRPPEFLIEIKSKEYDFEIQVEKIHKFLYAFALFKSEIIQIKNFWCITPKFYPVESKAGREILQRRGRINTTATLLPTEIIPFINFYTRFKKINTPTEFEIAIKRFYYGLQSRSIDDSVLDFMIALECLCGDNKSELTRTISIRAAILLGKDELDTERLRNHMSALYGIRSAIAHGGNLNNAFKKAHITENQAREKLKEITRLTILSFLNLIENKRILGSKDTIQSIQIDLDKSISSHQYRNNIQKIANVKNPLNHDSKSQSYT